MNSQSSSSKSENSSKSSSSSESSNSQSSARINSPKSSSECSTPNSAPIIKENADSQFDSNSDLSKENAQIDFSLTQRNPQTLIKIKGK